MEVKSELYEEQTFQKVVILENSKFSKSTVIPLVGLQIWRGAFLLADYILSQRKPLFEDKVVLELAAGVGFTGVIAGMVAREIVCTDVDKGGILELIQRNFKRNNHLMKASTSVLSLDFYQEDWSPALERKLKETDIIIAADVIYDNNLSEAFVKCLTRILQMPPKKTFLLALEKRFVFTVEDLDVVAPCYDHFFKYLKSQWSSPPMSNWTIQQLDLDFQQMFAYERTKHLVLWMITA
uniref:Methyltransferase-like protein 22 n=1 Tax=Lygus hesperus TaxID=30085 RepID=A0A0K8TGH5_LYGHE